MSDSTFTPLSTASHVIAGHCRYGGDYPLDYGDQDLPGSYDMRQQVSALFWLPCCGFEEPCRHAAPPRALIRAPGRVDPGAGRTTAHETPTARIQLWIRHRVKPPRVKLRSEASASAAVSTQARPQPKDILAKFSPKAPADIIGNSL